MSTRDAAEIAADRIALAACHAGSRIWLAIEQAMECGMSGRKARRAFDAMVESLAGELPALECDLFQAYAYEALPLSDTTTVERAEIDSNAWRAYDDYCQTLMADMEAAAIDHAYDTARDARLTGAA